MHIQPRQPFDFRQTLRFILSPPALGNGRQFLPLLDHFESGEYRRVVRIGEHPVLYGVWEGGAGLKVRILSGPNDAATERAVRALAVRQFATDLDLAPFYRQAESDPVLSCLARHFRGMRIPQAPRVFETLISAVLEQQVNLTFAHQVKKALIEAYGAHVEWNGRRYNSFPEPSDLAIRTPAELRRLQISGPKARYLIGISRASLDGTIDLERLYELEPAEAHRRLCEHKGVGPWTAHYVGMRALGHLDCLPVADVGLQKAIQRFYGLRKLPSAARIQSLARAWRDWRSYATFYLWLTYWETPEWREKLQTEIRERRSGAEEAAATAARD
jgi:DNA-3-methyladenine glycosylase II